MNQTQRQFLINKIKEKASFHDKMLKESLPEAPNLSNYLLHSVMSGNFDIVSNDRIKEIILEMALTGNEKNDWMGGHWGTATKSNITFKAKDIFVMPDAYNKMWDEYKDKRNEIEQKRTTLSIQLETLITRIQLASDKTLQTMIDEVDDMGDISLMDTKLKLLK